MVRIYANLVGLSKALNRVRLAGAEKRSLAPFFANFSRSYPLFDFVDSGELKENADAKMRGMLQLFADNAQCKHIWFAGCHDVGYINDLTPYDGNRDRITLVRRNAFHPEFSKLRMRVEDFPNLFRSSPLDGQPLVHRSHPSATAHRGTLPQSLDNSSEEAAKVCYYFQKGKCQYGNGCKNLHV